MRYIYVILTVLILSSACNAESSPNAPAVPSLIQALESKDKYVREQAAKALGNIGLPASAAIPLLANALKMDEDEFVRQNAAEALGKIDLTNPETVSALIAGMTDPSGRVRSAAAPELVKVGPINKEVIAAFICAADDNWKYVIYACDKFFNIAYVVENFPIVSILEEISKTDNTPKYYIKEYKK